MEQHLDSLAGVPVRVFAPASGGAHGANGATLLYHGLRSSSEVHEREARRIASEGITVYLPDAPHHGARRSEVIETMPDALGLEGHRVLLRILREARDEVPALVDALLAHGHDRVAIAGISMGAFVALAAATTEPRLAAIVSILGSPDWTPRTGEIPSDIADLVAESPHLRLEAFPPRPLLLLNGGRDDNVRPGPARDLAARLAPLYAKASAASGTLVHREYPDAGHFPSAHDWDDMWSTAAAFLARALTR